MNRSVARRRYLRIGIAILLLLAIAALFRLWRIGSTPPGLFGDEAVNGLDALDVLAGRGRIFFPANYGREGLHMFIIAAFFKLMGVTPLVLRLPSVIAGLTDCPVIGVPTSIGYGASFGGLSALLTRLYSCASGVSVVNIDNGFGAGFQAHLINRIGEPPEAA